MQVLMVRRVHSDNNYLLIILIERHNIPCKDNPNCFEMLGQSELTAKTKALPTTLGPNPSENMRKDGFPAGLKVMPTRIV